VITLLEIVTVAPPVREASGGISMPPPAAHCPATPKNADCVDAGLDRATPPVIVTPEIDTVGSVDASSCSS
jgi:hypothetical protein